MSLSVLRRDPVLYLDRINEEVVVFQKGAEDPSVVRDVSGRYVAIPGGGAARVREWMEEFARLHRLSRRRSPESFNLFLADKPRLLAGWLSFKSEKAMEELSAWVKHRAGHRAARVSGPFPDPKPCNLATDRKRGGGGLVA